MAGSNWFERGEVFSSIRNFWRLAIPLWHFRDASRGTLEQRMANYRYNRSQRKILPFYVMKWIGIATCLLLMMQVLSEMMLLTAAGSANHLCATLACMSAGIGFAFACVVVAVLFASYLFLTYIKR
ncbi:hypothetical protein [Noviherbaspirillum massiliense]|uniref:hypothetical protein n=1 Tax=Noviherbaspirillum massiliense TaxID=1465823 RepID=UPI0002FAE6DF|nr:hypothetical protein [Noviherbaspirillum massiliense]